MINNTNGACNIAYALTVNFSSRTELPKRTHDEMSHSGTKQQMPGPLQCFKLLKQLSLIQANVGWSRRFSL